MQKAVILAAGEGKRLRPFTEDMPKVMLPIANKPILEYVIEALADNNIRNIIMVVGYKKESIMSYFGDGNKWGVEINYVFQEKQIGTAHALLQAKDYIDDEFLVLPGDNIIDKECIAKLIKEKEKALVIEESELSSKYGVVKISDGYISQFEEKPVVAETNIISTGIYKFEPDIIDLVEQFVSEGKNNLTDVIQHIIKSGEKIKGIKGNGKWKDAVYPWDLLKMNADALREIPPQQAGKIEENVVIKGKVSIGEDSIIHSGCYIMGPVIIGKGCEIGPNACIFPSTSIGNNVTIYPFSEIRDAIIMDDVTIGSLSYISKSVIGKGTKIGSHFSTIVGNALMEVENEIHKVKEIGTFIGGDCKVDANVTIEAGVIIGKKCKISSHKLINKNLDSNSQVI